MTAASELLAESQPADASSDRIGAVLLAVAMISAVVLMAPVWNAGPLALDEHGSYWIVDAEQPGSIWSRCLNVAATPPLFSWIQQASLLLFGKGEWQLRLPTVLGYLLSVVAIYGLGRSLAGPKVGGLAALILAWHPEVVDEVRIARCYGVLLLFSVLLLLATAYWRQRPISLWRTSLWSIAAMAVIWTHYLGAPLVAVSWLSVGCRKITGWKPYVAMVVGGVIVVLTTLPLLPAIERLAAWGPFLNYQVGARTFGSLFGSFWWAGLPLSLLLATVGGWMWRFRGSTSVRAIREHPAWLPVLWSIVPLLILSAAAHGDRSSLSNPRYRVPYAVGSACLLAALLPTRRQPWLAASCVSVGLAASWSLSERLPWQLGRLGDAASQDWYEIGRHIERRGAPGEPVFVQGGLIESHLVPVYCRDEVFLEYVACRLSRFYLTTPHPRYGLPFLWNPETGVIDCIEQRIDAMAGDLWVACATDSDLNRSSGAGLGQLLPKAGYRLTEEQVLPTAVLQRWQRR